MNAVKIIRDFINKVESEIENNKSLEWIWNDYNGLGEAFIDGLKLDDEEIIEFASEDYKSLVKDAREIIVDRYAFRDEKVHRLIYLPSIDVYLNFEGYYNSYEGTTFQAVHEVQPVQKTVTIYEPKN